MMNPIIILMLLTSVFTGVVQPYDVNIFSDAIVQTGHGEALWYTPRVATTPLKNAPYGWKGATSCFPPIYSGVIYINPKLDKNEIPITVMHELIHLHNGCRGAEYITELETLDVLAFLNRKQDVFLDLIIKLKGAGRKDLPYSIIKEYYLKPVNYILYNKSLKNEYPYLYNLIIDIGLIEREWDGKK